MISFFFLPLLPVVGLLLIEVTLRVSRPGFLRVKESLPALISVVFPPSEVTEHPSNPFFLSCFWHLSLFSLSFVVEFASNVRSYFFLFFFFLQHLSMHTFSGFVPMRFQLFVILPLAAVVSSRGSSSGNLLPVP